MDNPTYVKSGNYTSMEMINQPGNYESIRKPKSDKEEHHTSLEVGEDDKNDNGDYTSMEMVNQPGDYESTRKPKSDEEENYTSLKVGEDDKNDDDNDETDHNYAILEPEIV